MNEDETTELVDRLGMLVQDRPPPLTRLVADSRRARVRRRRVRATGALAGAALVVGAGVVVVGPGPLGRAGGPIATDPSPAPGFHSAHTGEQPSDAEDLRLGGPGEKLDPSGDDFAQVVREVTTDIPFPSETARRVSAQFQYVDLHDETDSRVSTGALRGFVANDAICSWANAWAVAITADDAAGKAAATDAMLDASSWPAVTDLDQRFTGESRFSWLPRAQGAARGDDVRAMGKALGTNVFCVPALIPDLQQALPKELRP